MHIYATQEDFSKALATVSRVIAPQNNMPVLAGVELDVRDNRLTLSATDLFTTIHYAVPVEAESTGTVVLPASLLTDLVSKIPTATLELQVESSSGKTLIKYGKNRATLHGFGVERLPNFEMSSDMRASVTIGEGVFSKLARQLLFACAKDETRPILRGISVKVQDGRMVFAATDGSRLSQSWVAIPEYRGEPFECVVPAKLISEAARLTANLESTLYFGANYLRIQTSHTTLIARLLDGQYPDYQHVIPQEYVIEGHIHVSDFRGALERTNLIAAKDRTSSVRIRPAIGQLDILASAAEYGEAFESVNFDSHGIDLELLFNPVYLLDALKSIEADDAVLEFSGVQSPLRIRDLDNAQYSHVVLPLRQLV